MNKHYLPRQYRLMKQLIRKLCSFCTRIKEEQRLKKLRRRNSIELYPPDLGKIKIRIKGSNNVVRIGKLGAVPGRIDIRICGDNNEVTLGTGLQVSQFLNIAIGADCANFGAVSKVKVSVGDGTGFESTKLQTYNSNSSITIGDGCMFSFGIQVYNTDAHAILDAQTGTVINKVRNLTIGNHVWVGANVTIMKNVTIADDCVIGWGSVVSGKFTEPNCILAGNPARIIKQGITWEANGARCGYIANE